MMANESAIADGRAWWFFDALVIVHAGYEETGGSVTFMETLSPGRPGDFSPLHVHREQEEGFRVVEGSLRVYIGADTIELRAGDFVLAPRAVPHTYEVTSENTTHLSWVRGPFDKFLESVAVPAKELRAPSADEIPSGIDPAELARKAEEVGVTILGPPGMLPTELPEFATGRV